jgi:hypothetical protein
VIFCFKKFFESWKNIDDHLIEEWYGAAKYGTAMRIRDVRIISVGVIWNMFLDQSLKS